MEELAPIFKAKCWGEQTENESAGSPEKEASTFATTHWSVVLSAGQDDFTGAAAALEELCRKYWYPLYAFVRRRGSDQHEAEDLTQAFFAFLLENETLKKVNRQRGKFRSFLLAAFTNFLNNEWDRQQTLKRGGHRLIVSLDEMAAEEKYLGEPADSVTPERLFERRWAQTLLEDVLNRLRQEYIAEEKSHLFSTLESGLTGELDNKAYSSWSVTLGMSQGAVRVAMHRMRRRFGQLLREEIALTVTAPWEVDDEICQLFSALEA